jgi:Protein of unknown function (DUF3710)
MVFRRRRETDDSPAEEDLDVLDDTSDEADSAEVSEPASSLMEDYAVVVPPRPTGPWDITDVPKGEHSRLDLGGIQIEVSDGLEVRVEVQDDVPVAATLVLGASQLQVHAFAAPRSKGIWKEIREEIAESLRSSGGSAEDADGPFGAELKARIPNEGGTIPARFLGVDGPRWFLRGLLSGPASTDPIQAKALEDAFRSVVVNRGTDAMAPRDMIPLHLPREVADAAAQAAAEAEAEEGQEPDRRLELPERGPEITEIQ